MRLTNKQVKRLIYEELMRLDEEGPDHARVSVSFVMDDPEVDRIMSELVGAVVNALVEGDDESTFDVDILHADANNALYEALHDAISNLTGWDAYSGDRRAHHELRHSFDRSR